MVAVLLLIEVALRVVAPGENVPQREYDPHLGWRGRPDLDCVLNEGHFAISISQNSRGFRDAERVVEKPPGVVRILCCGDSFTWGWGVEQDEIYTAVLERRYTEAEAPVEVMNAGVGGYSTDQVLLYLLDEGLAYSPDHVVYQAAWNDVRDNPRTLVEAIYNKPAYELGSDGELVLRGSPVPPLRALGTIKYVVSRHSRLAYFLKHRLHVARFARAPDGEPAAEPAPAPNPTPHAPHGDAGAPSGGRDGVGYPFRLFCALVAEIDAACRTRGAGFTVLIDFEVSEEDREHWGRVCGHVDVRFVDRYLRARETPHTPAYIPRDGHWTPAGHQWIADLLYEDVLARWRPRGDDAARPDRQRRRAARASRRLSRRVGPPKAVPAVARGANARR